MQPHRIVSREEWLEARKAHLANEKALTKARDKLAAERRALPCVEVEKNYVFEATDGRRALADLFDGRSQLAVYHFMLTPGDPHVCEGCAFISDHVDGARAFRRGRSVLRRGVACAAFANPASKRRLGWTFEWVSSSGSDFNFDYGVSFTPEQIATGKPLYNYETTPFLAQDLHGFSVFARDETGHVFHTYSTYARGAETLLGAFNFLDFVPKGRNETGTMDWVRLHDEYRARPGNGSASCCRAEHSRA